MSPAQNTKIELATEAVEALILATVVATTANNDNERKANHENVVAARSTLRTAFKELLTPTLRVIDGASAAA